MWHIHTIRHYLALERKDILIHTSTSINFEDVELSQISHSQEDENFVIPLK